MRQLPILLGPPLILLLQLPIPSHNRRNLRRPVITHPLQGRVLPQGLLDFDGGLVDLDFEAVDVGAHVEDGLLVDVHLDAEVREGWYRCYF